MLFCQTFIFLFLLHFLSCNALQCTTNCTFTYNFTKSFTIPEQCNQIESAGKCSVHLFFYYNLGGYRFSFSASSLSTIFRSDNSRYVKLNLSSLDSIQLSYYIYRACKHKDDCARELAINDANEMLQRQIDIPGMINELQSVMIGPPLTSPNSKLICYDGKESIRQCATSMTEGTCVLSSEISLNKINRACSDSMREILVHMYQTNNDNRFNFQCDRSLCNDQATLRNIKKIMLKYNITKTPDGRLNGSRLIISNNSLMIMMIFTLLFNHF